MSDFSKADFDNFVRKFSEYLDAANESKKRGNNDYNPLKAVQSVNNEEKMHSGFLYSLLDTRGEHYQDDLFLKLFLQVLGLDRWFGSTKNARVKKEYQNIDIYITNGENHIIIENKIRAGDAYNQLARYIETIHNPQSSDNENDKSVNYENIAVVYLSPYGREPSQNSLDKWQIEIDFLECGDDKIEYRQISYQTDILVWIKKCKKEVCNITSLNSAFEFYKDIVKIITKQKESKMNVTEFFKEQKDFEIAFEICKNEVGIMNAYLGNIKDDIQKGIGDGWKVECAGEYLYVFSEIYGDEIAFLFDLECWVEQNEKKFRCWFYLEGHYDDTEKYMQDLQAYLSQELNGMKLKRFSKRGYNHFIYIEYLDIDELLKAKEFFLEFIKKYADLADKLNAKLKIFKP